MQQGRRGGRRGLDLDGSYHNRLKTVFSSVSAPCVSCWGSGGAFQRRARPDDFIAIWYLTSQSHSFTTIQLIPILQTLPLLCSTQ